MCSQKVAPQLAVKYPNCAGIDIGKKELFVAVSAAVAEDNVRTFSTVTAGLKEMAKWLRTCGVEQVAMEATSVYWIPPFEVLEASGFEVRLVDPRKTRRLDGRKTDVLDCQWIRQLMSFGLLAGAYRTPDAFLPVRAYVRQREQYIHDRARAVLHMQKALSLMNVQLSNFLSDIMGKSGAAIRRAIVAGERDPEVLVSLCDGRVRAAPEQLAQSLLGNWREEHLHALASALRQYDFMTQEILLLDDLIQQHTVALGSVAAATRQADDPPAKRELTKRDRSRQDRARQQVLWDINGVDLTAIEGIGIETAMLIVAELGGEVSAFPTAAQFCCWLGLAPNNRVSGTSLRRAKSRRANRLGQAFRQCAVTLRRTESWLGAKHRRRLARMEKAKAVKATAHELARIVYAMLSNRCEYVQRSLKEYEKQYQARKMHYLTKQARAVGYELTPIDPAAAATA